MKKLFTLWNSGKNNCILVADVDIDTLKVDYKSKQYQIFGSNVRLFSSKNFTNSSDRCNINMLKPCFKSFSVENETEQTTFCDHHSLEESLPHVPCREELHEVRPQMFRKEINIEGKKALNLFLLLD